MDLVVISHYAADGSSNLQQLLAQVIFSNPGCKIQICIVINCDGSLDDQNNYKNSTKVKIDGMIIRMIVGNEIDLPQDLPEIHWHVRDNIGMNIGAWDYGWRAHPDFEGYLFLQDEVNILEEKWCLAFKDFADKLSSKSKYLLIGETWNYNWEKSWAELRNSHENSVIVVDDAIVERVDYFLSCFKNWGLKALDHGGHLRSLIWYTNIVTLNAIDGFPKGENYNECIAAEIAVSLKVRALSGSTMQLDKSPFRYLWHPEWRRDGVSKIYKDQN